ncbi:MAG: hypothetical protein IH878_12145 [Gemmatimonadetes bacterium]|nr:hypothetical protein [Gemmatimonadota bacterium]
MSAQTVARLPDFFERVKDLPYKPGPAKALYNAYHALSSARIGSLYDAYLNSPVRLIDVVPLRWLLTLPKWASARAAGVAAWQWLGLGFGLAVGLIVILVANRAARRLARRKQIDPGIGWHRLLTPLAVILVTGFLIPRVNFILHIGGDPLIFIAYALTTALFLSVTWIALIGGNILGEIIVMSRNLRQRSMDSQLIRLGDAGAAG